MNIESLIKTRKLEDEHGIMAHASLAQDERDARELASMTLAERQEIGRRVRRALGGRNVRGCGRNIDVEISAEHDEPCIAGDSWCYKTRGGRVIDHPSAYSKTGWSNMIYHASTRRLACGVVFALDTLREIRAVAKRK